MSANKHIATILAAALCTLWLAGCNITVDQADLDRTRVERVDVFFNDTGTRAENEFDTEADTILIQLIDKADVSIDFAVMGFSNRGVIAALVRAHDRGVRLRFVGDARHQESNYGGYAEMDQLNIPMLVGNLYSIMHNKFFVFDSRYVLTGTGNITSTGFRKNDNNWVLMDSPQVATEFTAEFEQMFGGKFGYAKEVIDNGNVYQLGDTQVEVYFSPQEDTVGQLVQAVRDATQSVHFFIFAFTKDEVGAALIEKHLEFEQYNRCCDPNFDGELSADEDQLCALQVTCDDVFVRREVRGVLDRSQLHGNGPYHEAYRLLMWQVPMRLDGNDNSYLPGDYQAGGGRQHSKTMVIDGATAHASVLTGSFNWSSSATVSNDETLLVLRGERMAGRYEEFFERLWVRGKTPGNDFIGRDVEIGDIVFNEVHWDGWNGELDPSQGDDPVNNDEFIELLNTTDHPVDLSLWQITTADDFVVGFFPGTIIGPYERFLVLDHNLIPYDDLNPQDGGTAFLEPDFVMNMANDARFLRLNLRNLALRLELRDPAGNVIDVAGDGGPPFFGGRSGSGDAMVNRSMERRHVPCGDDGCYPFLPGDSAEAWQACQLAEGGDNVAEAFRSRVIATPGQTNSGGELIPEEDPSFRSPQAADE